MERVKMISSDMTFVDLKKNFKAKDLADTRTLYRNFNLKHKFLFTHTNPSSSVAGVLFLFILLILFCRHIVR